MDCEPTPGKLYRGNNDLEFMESLTASSASILPAWTPFFFIEMKLVYKVKRTLVFLKVIIGEQVVWIYSDSAPGRPPVLYWGHIEEVSDADL